MGPTVKHNLDHVGIAVADPQGLATLLRALLGLTDAGSDIIEREGIAAHFLDAGGAKLELLESIAPNSSIARYVDSGKGGLHHLAFKVPDIDVAIKRVRNVGFPPLSAEPLPGAQGKRIFFLHPKDTGGVLIEFCEVPEPLAPVMVVGPTQVKDVAKDLSNSGLNCTVASSPTAVPSTGAHLVLHNANATAVALAYTESRWLSVSMVQPVPVKGQEPVRALLPTLIIVPDDAQNMGRQLQRKLFGSSLCVLPVLPESQVRVNTASMAAALRAHMEAAQS